MGICSLGTSVRNIEYWQKIDRGNDMTRLEEEGTGARLTNPRAHMQ